MSGEERRVREVEQRGHIWIRLPIVVAEKTLVVAAKPRETHVTEKEPVIAEALVENHLEGVVLAKCGRESGRCISTRIRQYVLTERRTGRRVRVIRERDLIDSGADSTEIILDVVVLRRLDGVELNVFEGSTLLTVDSPNLVRNVASELLLPAQDVLVNVRELGPSLDPRLATSDRSPVGLIGRRRATGGEVPVGIDRRSEAGLVREGANRKVVRNALEVAGSVDVRFAAPVAADVPRQANARRKDPIELVFSGDCRGCCVGRRSRNVGINEIRIIKLI